MVKGYLSSLSKANTSTESLRTTVPSAIVKNFDLTNKDKLSWTLEAEEGEIIIKVKPLKEEGGHLEE